MGLIKFEVEIPEFDEEISIIVTLKKDGKVVETSTSPSTKPSTVPSPTAKPSSPKKNKVANSSNSLLGGGNMMNLDI